MEKKIELGMLCEIYGNLLTEKQKEVINDYANQDLSLTEIAENNNITRQAVRDIIQKAEKKLYEYEEKLELNKKRENSKKNEIEIIQEIEKIKIEVKEEETKSKLENIEKMIEANNQK